MSEDIIINPHDKFVKEMLTDKELAVNFLQNYLPTDIKELVNFEKVGIEKDSFITEELQEYFSDLLYKVEILGKESYIYMLFEHKSYPDKFIGIQLLEYLIQCWKTKRKNKESFPLVLPLVIYHGNKKWNVGTKFSDLFDIKEEALLKYLPDFEYILYDLSKYNDNDLIGSEKLKIMFLLLKYIFNPELLEKVIESKIHIIGKDIYLLKTVIMYISNEGEVNTDKFIELLNSVSKEGGEFAMTIVQQSEKRGEARGKIEGFLDIKFGESGLKLMNKVKSIKNAEKLEELSKKIREAKELIEVENFLKD